MFSVSGWLELSHVIRIFEALAKIAPKGATAVSDGATTLWKKGSGPPPIRQLRASRPVRSAIILGPCLPELRRLPRL